jgi:hypothetical protein
MIFLFGIAHSIWIQVSTLFPLRLPNNNIFLLSGHYLINGLVQEKSGWWLHELLLRGEPDGGFHLSYFAMSPMDLLMSGLGSFIFNLIIDRNFRVGFITFVFEMAL